MTRVVLVPGVLALLPEYAGIEDPVAELRAACLGAVRWLGGEVTVFADPQGERVAEHLLEGAGVSRLASLAPRPPAPRACLVVGNGSARRTEKAPGHLDERAEAFDAELGARLRAGRFEVDEVLAEELLASVSAIASSAGRWPARDRRRSTTTTTPTGCSTG